MASSAGAALHERAELLDLTDDLEKTSLDLYAAVRSLYRQHRADVIGNEVDAGANLSSGAADFPNWLRAVEKFLEGRESKRMKASIAAIFFLFVVATAPVADASDLEEGANAFIKALEQEAIASLTDTAKPRGERVVAFRKLFDEKFAVSSIGRFTMGRNWRNATEGERDEFLKLFEELMVATYVDRFESYSGEQVDILKTTPVDENRATVYSEISRNGGEGKPISVLWRVGRQGDIYKILDVVVEGASMSITLQREFASIIKNTGSVAGLIEELRKKTAELNPS